MTRIIQLPDPTNRPSRCGAILAAFFLACLALPLSAVAGTLYWDINGNSAGAGGSTPSDTWSTSGSNRNWSTSSSGTSGGNKKWSSGDDAVFSAGNDATGSYTVTVSGTQTVSSILIEDGNPTFTSGTLDFDDASPDLTINTEHTLNFESALTSSGTGGLNLGGGGTLSLANSTSLSGTFDLGVSGTAGTTLRLEGITLTLGTLNVTANSTIDFAGSVSTLNVTNLSIAEGVTLTITNWQSAIDYFSATNWSGAVANTIGVSPMNRVAFNPISSGFTGWTSAGEVRPMPEPSTYDMILIGLTGAFLGWRRWHRRISA